MRILGARHLAQASIAKRYPSPLTATIGLGVDALHAASMLMLAQADSSHRRLALIDAGIAGALASTEASSALAGYVRHDPSRGQPAVLSTEQKPQRGSRPLKLVWSSGLTDRRELSAAPSPSDERQEDPWG
jgi:hypothetical protein